MLCPNADMLQHEIVVKHTKSKTRGHAPHEERTLVRGTPLQDLGARGTWMGYGLDLMYVGTRFESMLPLDTIHYLLWAQKYAEQEDATHLAIVADDIMISNGLSLQDARKLGQQLKSSLETIAMRYNLDRIDVRTWQEVASEKYQEKLTSLKELIWMDKELLEHIVQLVPGMKEWTWKNNDEIKAIPEKANYAVEEIALTLYLADRGEYPIKIGHTRERGYDNRALEIVEGSRQAHSDPRFQHTWEKLSITRVPTTLYLYGGYSTDVVDKNAVISPYLIGRDPAKRILCSDTQDTIREKLAKSTSLYRHWLTQALDLLTYEVALDSAQNIEDAVISAVTLQ